MLHLRLELAALLLLIGLCVLGGDYGRAAAWIALVIFSAWSTVYVAVYLRHFFARNWELVVSSWILPFAFIFLLPPFANTAASSDPELADAWHLLSTISPWLGVLLCFVGTLNIGFVAWRDGVGSRNLVADRSAGEG